MPLIAAIPAIIGAGGGIASALLGKKKGASNVGGAGPLLPQGLDQNALLSGINSQKGLASTFQTQGAGALKQGQDTLTGPLKYLQGILGGDRTSIMEQMALEIAAINAQFRAPLAQANITGRGTSLAPDLEAGKQSAISNQIFQARPAAADKLTSIAQGLMNLGTTQEQIGAGVLSDTTHEILDYNSIIRGIQAQTSGQSSALFGQLGAQLGPLLASILGGGKGGPAAPPVPKIDPNVLLPPSSPGSNIDPALISSLINLGGGAPSFNSSWLDGGIGGGNG